MHKTETVLVDEVHKILWDFEMHKNHLILAKRLDLILKREGVSSWCNG